MDRAKARQIRLEIEALLMKHGLEVTKGRATFSENDLKLSFAAFEPNTVQAPIAPGSNTSSSVKQAPNLLFHAKSNGLDATKVVTYRGDRVMLVDYHPRKYKYPWIVQVVGSSQKFKYGPQLARSLFGV